MASVALAAGVAAAAAAPPNLIFILSDDLGYGDYSISPDVNRTRATIPTPNIQRLADAGVKMLRAYSGPVCAPSRCTLMTGLHQGHCTIRGNDGSYSPLLPSDPGVAKVLQGKYVTGLVGKWGLGDYGTTGYPLEQGFDYFVGQDSQVACHDWYPTVIQNNTDGKQPLNDPSQLGKGCLKQPGTAGATNCTWTNQLDLDLGVAFIRQHAGGPKPFFLYLASTTPHVGNLKGYSSEFPVPWPYNAAEFIDPSWPAQQQQFASAVWAQDKIVGAVLDELAAQGIEERTVVFFSGDNGPDSHDFTLFDDPGPFRGKKRSLHEGGVRQTVAVQWKGTLPAGQTTDHLFAFWDVLPTAAELAGIPEKEWPQTDGVSIAPLLTGMGQQKQHEYLYWEFCMHSKVNGLLPQQYPVGWGQSLRFDGADGTEWKAIRVDRESTLLYNLTADITESTDLAAAHPDVVKKAAGLMEAAHTETDFWPSTHNSSQKCCAACYNHQGCAAPCKKLGSVAEQPSALDGTYSAGAQRFQLKVSGAAVQVVNADPKACWTSGTGTISAAGTITVATSGPCGVSATGTVDRSERVTTVDHDYVYRAAATTIRWATAGWSDWVLES
eukprot:TRINITY_DN8558_c0_g1_i1.p1 TRINITY_DN8558_c0_g1~~TRINITY_DN8558_c0_g1_i1.p1  ORF type:complete len:628 (+),score=240.10 TRINITY_DN8558_c0_g1_i1:65-1885(+)